MRLPLLSIKIALLGGAALAGVVTATACLGAAAVLAGGCALQRRRRHGTGAEADGGRTARAAEPES